MKKYRSFLALFLLLTLILTPAAYASAPTWDDPFTLQAEAAILIEADTGEILFELNPDERRYPASLTKIMTGMLTAEAVERGELTMEQEVTMPEDLYSGIGYDGSSINLKVGEIVTVGDLLYAALLPSANEACNALAVVVAGSIPKFVELMNQRAQELGMTSTHYSNTHGYHEDSHYTTARDISKLCLAAMSNPTFRTVVATPTYTIAPTNMTAKERVLKDTNALVSNSVRGYKYQYAIGIKTGFTSKAGYCLASAAQKNSRTLIAVLMGGKNWIEKEVEITDNYFTESRRLLEHGFNDFSRKTILDQIEPIQTIPVTLCAEQDYITVQPAESLFATLPNDLDPASFTREITLPETLEAPIEKGAALGTITLSYRGTVLGSADLVASNSLERSQFLYTLAQIRWFFSLLWVRVALLVLILIILFFSIRRAILGPSHRRRRRGGNVYAGSYRGRR